MVKQTDQLISNIIKDTSPNKEPACHCKNYTHSNQNQWPQDPKLFFIPQKIKPIPNPKDQSEAKLSM